MTPLQEEDLLPRARVLVVGAAGVAATALGTLIAWLLGSMWAEDLGSRLAHQGQGALPPGEVSHVRTELFDPPLHPPPAAAPSSPDGYGWIDRRAGVVRIPIDRAIDLEVEDDARAEGRR